MTWFGWLMVIVGVSNAALFPLAVGKVRTRSDAVTNILTWVLIVIGILTVGTGSL